MNLRSAYDRIVRRTKTGARSTLENDVRAIGQFEELVPRIRTVDISDIDNATMAEFRKNWVDSGGNAASGNKHLAKVRAILRYLAELGHLNCVPIFRKIPEDEPQPRAASDDEIARMLQCCAGAKWPTVVNAAAYWRAVILTGVNLGLARKEILNLEWSDINRETMAVEFDRQKTRKGKGLPFTVKTLNAWECIRIEGSARVFYSTQANKQFYREWHALQDRAKIVEHYGTHDMRKTCCNRVYDVKGLYAAAEVMGHSTTAVTSRHYLTRTRKSEHLRPAVEQAEYGRDSTGDDREKQLIETFRRLSEAGRDAVLRVVSAMG